MIPERINRARGCLLGLAVGDAVGTTVEFKPRGSFPLVTDMVGGGPFRLKAGEWMTIPPWHCVSAPACWKKALTCTIRLPVTFAGTAKVT